MASKVSFEDVDNDSIKDAVFLSQSDEKSSNPKPVIRMVLSRSFSETKNFNQLQDPPHPSVKILPIDIDFNEGPLELMYLNQSKTAVVILNTNGSEEGTIRIKLPLVESVANKRKLAFAPKTLGTQRMVELGDNVILIKPGGVTIESGLLPIHGGWSPFSDWSTCNKACGDGVEMRTRLCNNPEPRNAGAFCSGTGMQTRACNVRACVVADCKPNETFENGNCAPDPTQTASGSSGGSGGSLTSGGGSGGSGGSGLTGGGGSGGGSGGGGGLPNGPEDCPSGKVWNPRLYNCFKPYAVNNIFLSHQRQAYNPTTMTYEIYYHRRRLSLNHPKAVDTSVELTATQYCRFAGHVDYISFTTDTYTANGSNENVFILCNITTNGYYFQGNDRCVVGNTLVSFRYSGMDHNPESTVRYLKSVVCRRDN